MQNLEVLDIFTSEPRNYNISNYLLDHLSYKLSHNYPPLPLTFERLMSCQTRFTTFHWGNLKVLSILAVRNVQISVFWGKSRNINVHTQTPYQHIEPVP